MALMCGCQLDVVLRSYEQNLGLVIWCPRYGSCRPDTGLIACSMVLPAALGGSAMSDSLPSVGVLGAGVLGAAIMQRLLDQGFDVTVWNRSSAKLEQFSTQGAHIAATPRALAERVDICLTCVTDGAAVEAIVFGQDGIAAVADASKTLVDMSTMDSNHARELAQRLHDNCAMPWLDAPISGGPPAAYEGRMTVMVGGDEGVFERMRPLWNALAGNCTLMGANGAGQATKMVNQVLVACGFVVLAEACGLAERAGVDAARLAEVFAGGRADSRLLQEYAKKMATSDFAVGSSISIIAKDLRLIHTLADGLDAPMPITSAVAEVHRKMISDGYGDADNSELIRFYRTHS